MGETRRDAYGVATRLPDATNHSTYHYCVGFAGQSSAVPLQLGLGLLPERRPGPDFDYPHYLGGYGSRRLRRSLAVPVARRMAPGKGDRQCYPRESEERSLVAEGA